MTYMKRKESSNLWSVTLRARNLLVLQRSRRAPPCHPWTLWSQSRQAQGPAQQGHQSGECPHSSPPCPSPQTPNFSFFYLLLFTGCQGLPEKKWITSSMVTITDLQFSDLYRALNSTQCSFGASVSPLSNMYKIAHRIAVKSQ